MPEPAELRLDTQRDDLVPAYDVAVIGGGVNGLAVAREAAMSGLSVILLERDDLGAQTSSISTRLIHGGLKYLERLDIALVLESIREQRRLLQHAPHLVQVYPMLIPFYRANTRPGWLIACGLVVFKVLARGRFRARAVRTSRLRRGWPSLEKTGLRWGVLFDDAQVPWTERLCVELALSAQAHGAHVLTGADVVGLEIAGSEVRGVHFVGPHGERTVQAAKVVNAAGPWVDHIVSAAVPDAAQLVGPTKGSHIIVDPFPGAPATCVFFEARSDRRPMFVLPWAGRYMIGCTDIPYSGNLTMMTADDIEIDYLLSEVNLVIPAARLDHSDVLWSYAGVRPLPYVGGMTDPSKVTRGHEVLVDAAGLTNLITIVGGKFTTHRALGEDVVAAVREGLALPKMTSPTRTAAFPGSPAAGGYSSTDEFAAEFARTWDRQLGAKLATRLVSLYGTRATGITALMTSDPELTEVIDNETGAVAAEVAFAVQAEGAVSLEDIMLRRILLGLNGDVGVSAAPRVARLAQRFLGWSDALTEKEIASYLAMTARFRPRGANTDTDEYPPEITRHNAS